MYVYSRAADYLSGSLRLGANSGRGSASGRAGWTSPRRR